MRGQLGDGTQTSQLIAVDVNGLTESISAISVGETHSCALTALGGVKCWGYNFFGQLGNGVFADEVTTPVDVVGLQSGVNSLAAGGNHSCAITSAGGVKCWGYNDAGQLGNGDTGGRRTPVDVIGLGSGFSGVTAGKSHTCAVAVGGSVKCWGRNLDGQLGDASTAQRVTAVDTLMATAPGAPTNLVATGGAGSVTVGFTPSADGGREITGYTASSSPGGLTSTGCIVSPCVVTGLTKGTTYTFTVTATNAIGTSSASSPSNPVEVGSQTITFAPNPGPFTFGGASGSAVATASSGLAVSYGSSTSSVCLVDDSSGAISVLTAGECVVTANQAGNENYSPAPQVTLTVVINKASQTIVFGANPGPLTFAGSSGSAVASASSGLAVAYGTATSSVCSVNGSSGAITVLTAGDCVVTADQVGNVNYNAAPSVSQTVVINKATQTVTLSGAANSFVSGQTTILAATGGPSGNSVLFASETPTNCSVQGENAGTATAIGAGECRITASQAGNLNYLAAAPVTTTIDVLNAPPIAVNDSFTKNGSLVIGGDVLSNDFDPGNDALTVTVEAAPQFGSLMLAASGVFEYRPNSLFAGADDFTYRLTDAFGESTVGAVSLNVTVPNAHRVSVVPSVALTGMSSIPGGEMVVTTAGSSIYRLLPDLSRKHTLTIGNVALNSAALLADGTAYLAGSNTFLYVFTPSGVSRDRWPRALGSPVAESMSVDAAGSVFVCPENGIVQAISATNSLQGSALLGGPCAAAPLLLPEVGLGVVVSTSGDGAVFSLSRFVGSELDIVRRFLLPAPVATSLSATSASSFVWVDQAGNLRRADAVNSAANAVSVGPIGYEPVGAMLTLQDGKVVVAGNTSRQGRVCMFSSDLTPIWCSSLESKLSHSGVLGRTGEAFFGLDDGTITRVDLVNGAVLTAVQATSPGHPSNPSMITSDVLFDGVRVSVGDSTGSLAVAPLTTFDGQSASNASRKAQNISNGYWTGAMGGPMRNGRAAAVQSGAFVVFANGFETPR